MKKLALVLLILVISIPCFSSENASSLNVSYDYFTFPVYEVSKHSLGADYTKNVWYSDHLGITYDIGAIFPLLYTHQSSSVSGIRNSVSVNIDGLFSYRWEVKNFSFICSLGLFGEIDVLRLSNISPTVKLNLGFSSIETICYSFNDYVGIRVGVRIACTVFSHDVISTEHSYAGFSTLMVRPFIGFEIYSSDNNHIGKK